MSFALFRFWVLRPPGSASPVVAWRTKKFGSLLPFKLDWRQCRDEAPPRPTSERRRIFEISVFALCFNFEGEEKILTCER